MAQVLATDFPIDPTVTSGTQLADILNRWHSAAGTNFSGTTRPANTTAGGTWVKTGPSTQLQLMWFDGTTDHPIGTVAAPGGTAVIGAPDNSVAMAILFGG
jgi:hypothetical protein